MAIDKKIHYIWLGGRPKSRFVTACINSWHKNLPGYEIVEWNEKNLDLEKLRKSNAFFDKCMKYKLWAFASDYLRLHILYNYGGIYLDTDIQVVKSFDYFLENKMFLGYEDQEKGTICTAVIGAEKNCQMIKNILDFYDDDIYKTNLYVNPGIFRYSIDNNSELYKNLKVYDQVVFSPFNPFKDYTFPVETNDTCAIHWYTGNWGMTRKGYVYLNTKHLSGGEKIYQTIRKTLGYYKNKK